MRKGTKEIIIAALALLAAGIILGILSVQITLQSSYSFIKFDRVSPGTSVTHDINMTAVYKYNKPGVNMSLVVDSEPEDVPMNVQVMQPDGEKLIDLNFSDNLLTTFVPTIIGEHIVTIRNLGVDNASVRIETGTSSLLANSYFSQESMISRNLGLTALLIFLGLIVLIYGGIIFQLRGRKTVADEVMIKPVGLRVYTLLTGVGGILIILTASEVIPILLSTSVDIQYNALLMTLTIMLIMIGIGVTYLLIMAGLLYFRKSWIWTLAVIMATISIGFSLISIIITGLVGQYYQYPLTIAITIINGALLYYLYRPPVRQYFARNKTLPASPTST